MIFMSAESRDDDDDNDGFVVSKSAVVGSIKWPVESVVVQKTKLKLELVCVCDLNELSISINFHHPKIYLYCFRR